MDKVYCRIRKMWVAATPEEKVRQYLLGYMIANLGFPEGGIALEKGLNQMPHLALVSQKIPDRRADIVCFAKGIHPRHELYPLLLIECKAVKLTPKVINQVTGYNHFMQSYYVCVANQDQIRTGWYDKEKKAYTFVDYLPAFADLLATITARKS